MTTYEETSTFKRTAQIVGALFLTSNVTFILGAIVFDAFKRTVFGSMANHQRLQFIYRYL